ncbi:MAG: hypothetical protein ACE5J7_03140 [Candidatus Aenigmatarchaeota archaeon]
MVKPAKGKIRRGKPGRRQEKEIAREYLHRLLKRMEEGEAGKELLPAAEYLCQVSRIELTPLAKQRAGETETGKEGAFRILREIGDELSATPHGLEKSEVNKLRLKLEERVR